MVSQSRTSLGAGARLDTNASVATTIVATHSQYDSKRASGSGSGNSSPQKDAFTRRDSIPLAAAEGKDRPISDADPVDPNAIGHETCPICILDFEPGDDLRVLPCDGRHRFHQACVDPWLLELSSSCPLCREGGFCKWHFLMRSANLLADFLTLENMVLSGDDAAPNPDDDYLYPAPIARPRPPYQRSNSSNSQLQANRRSRAGAGSGSGSGGEDHGDTRRRTMSNPTFSKYLRFAQKRRNRETRGSRDNIEPPLPNRK